MKLMNKDEFVASLKELMTKLGKSEKDYTISFKTDASHEEENGTLSFTFNVKNKKEPKAKEYKIALYIFENKKTITTFIVNGRTLTLLFENSTINSPNISLYYLEDILLNEVKWVRNLEEDLKKKKEEAAKKKMETRRKYQNKDKYKKNNNSYKPYGNSGGRPQSSYSNNRNGLQIKTVRKPHENSKGGKR